MFEGIDKAFAALEKMNAVQAGQTEMNLALALTRFSFEFNKSPSEVIKRFTEIIEEAKKAKKVK